MIVGMKMNKEIFELPETDKKPGRTERNSPRINHGQTKLTRAEPTKTGTGSELNYPKSNRTGSYLNWTERGQIEPTQK